MLLAYTLVTNAALAEEPPVEWTASQVRGHCLSSEVWIGEVVDSTYAVPNPGGFSAVGETTTRFKVLHTLEGEAVSERTVTIMGRFGRSGWSFAASRGLFEPVPGRRYLIGQRGEILKLSRAVGSEEPADIHAELRRLEPLYCTSDP